MRKIFILALCVLCIGWDFRNKTPSEGLKTPSLGVLSASTQWEKVVFPSGFPSLGVSFSFNRSARAYSTSFNPDTYAAAMTITRTIYVNPSTGNDSTGNGTSGTPYKTIKKSLDIVAAGGDTAVKILVVTGGADVILVRDQYVLTSFTLTGKKVYIVPDDLTKKIFITSASTTLSWTLQGGTNYTYYSTRSAVAGVIDVDSAKDSFGVPTSSYTNLGSIAAVDAQAGSWYQSGSTIYVHTLTNAAPVFMHQLIILKLDIPFLLGTAAEVFLRNVYFMGNGTTASTFQAVTADYSDTRVTAYNCGFSYSFDSTVGNGISLMDIKFSQIYNSVASYNYCDGFNSHFTYTYLHNVATLRAYNVTYFNCDSFSNGLLNSSNSSNGFTTHEGATIAIISSRAYNTKGPVVANINGTLSFIKGMYSHDSVRSVNDTGHAAYYFDDATLPTGNTGGKSYLEDSTGSDSIWALSSDGIAKIYTRNFTGTPVETSTIPNVSKY